MDSISNKIWTNKNATQTCAQVHIIQFQNYYKINTRLWTFISSTILIGVTYFCRTRKHVQHSLTSFRKSSTKLNVQLISYDLKRRGGSRSTWWRVFSIQKLPKMDSWISTFVACSSKNQPFYVKCKKKFSCYCFTKQNWMKI